MARELQTLPDGWRAFLRITGFDFICEVDRESRYRYLNPTYEQALDLPSAEILGHTPAELGLIHPDDWPVLQEAIQPLFEENEPIRTEYRYRGRGGAWRWAESTAEAFLTEAGEWRAVFISRDTTERKELENSLAASEANYRSIIEHAVDAILIGNPRGEIIEANRRAFEITGYPAAELLGLNIADLFSPEERARVPLRYDLLDQGQDVRNDRFLRRRDGGLVPIEMNTRKLPDGRYQAFVRDVTERLRIQDELYRESTSLRNIIDHHPMSIQVVDTEGRTLKVNPAHTRLFDAVPPPDYSIWTDPLVERQGLGPLMQKARSGEVVFFPEFYYNVHELIADFPDHPIWLRMVAFPVKDKQGRPERYVFVHEDVTAKRAAEDALARTRGILMAAIEQSPSGIIVADAPDVRIRFANSAALGIRGQGVHQLTDIGFMEHGLRWQTFELDGKTPYPPEKLPLSRAILEGVESRNVEVIIRRDGGEDRIVSANAAPVRSPDGTIEAGVVIFHDITEAKRLENALRESERKLAELIDYLPDATLAIDRDRRVVIWNRAIEKMSGIPAAEMLGKSGYAYTVPFYGHPRSQLMDLLWKPDPELEAKYQSLRREGDTLFAEAFAPALYGGKGAFIWLKATALRDETGQIAGVIESIRDITDFKLAEQAVRESEDRFRGLYLNTTDSIFWIAVEEDGGFRYEGANPAHAILTGFPGEELIGRHPRQCFEAGLADRLMSNYSRCIASGVPICYDERFKVQGETKDLETLLVPIRNDQGRIYRLVGTSRDITQAKAAEEALRQAQKLESLGILAGGIAHDFNNLLTAILGNLNLAQLMASPESPAQPHLEAVEKIVLKASELTRQMLAYSGKGRFVVRAHDLNEVVQEMTHLLRVSISKKINLRLKLIQETVPVKADAAQIQQVIMNLVTNASDAIGDQEGTISIHTRKEVLDESYINGHFASQNLKPGPYATLDVSDSGCGIAPEVLDRIFDPFFTTKTSGRGLGLSAMLGILRGHGAGYKIFSEVGRGTTFKIFFPLAARLDGPVPSAEDAGGTSMAGRVLLVDDEPNILETIQTALQLLGLKVTTARDGQEAVQAFSREPDAFDVVLMDLTMPRMDGREAFLELRSIRPDVRVVLSSGYSEQESVQELLGQGLAGFIQKPYQLRELRQILARFLHS